LQPFLHDFTVFDLTLKLAAQVRDKNQNGSLMEKYLTGYLSPIFISDPAFLAPLN